MNNRVFSIDEDEMHSLTGVLDKAVSKLDTATSSMPNEFDGAQQSGLFDTTVSNLQKNFSKTSTFASNVKIKIERQNNAIFQNEALLTGKIEDMNEPQDFVKTYSRKYTSIDDIELSKRDDKSVNSGSNTITQNEIKDSKVEEEKLKDISAGIVEESDSNFDSKTKEEKIRDISKGEVQESEISSVDKTRVKEELKRLLGEVDENTITDENAIASEERVVDISNNNNATSGEFNFNTQSFSSPNSSMKSLNTSSEVSTSSFTSSNAGINKQTINNASNNYEESIPTFTTLNTGINKQTINNTSNNYEESIPIYSSQDNQKKQNDQAQEMLNNYSIMSDFERKRQQSQQTNEENEVY